MNQRNSTIERPLGFFEYFFEHGGFIEYHSNFFNDLFYDSTFSKIDEDTITYLDYDPTIKDPEVFQRTRKFSIEFEEKLFNECNVSFYLIRDKINKLSKPSEKKAELGLIINAILFLSARNKIKKLDYEKFPFIKYPFAYLLRNLRTFYQSIFPKNDKKINALINILPDENNVDEGGWQGHLPEQLLSFGYQGEIQKLRSLIQKLEEEEIDLINDVKTPIQDFIDIMTATDLSLVDKSIYFSCQTRQAAYILRKMEPWFDNLDFTTIGKSKRFFSKANKTNKAINDNLLSSSLSESRYKSPPKKKDEIDEIFHELQ